MSATSLVSQMKPKMFKGGLFYLNKYKLKCSIRQNQICLTNNNDWFSSYEL